MDNHTESVIFPINGTEKNTHRKLDIVFIHGLGGDPYSTWQQNEDRKSFWPSWLTDNFGNEVGIWTIGYPASPSQWDLDVMDLEDRAGNLLEQIAASKIGDRQILFIVHSMGGLVLKLLLEKSSHTTDNSKTKVLQQTKAIFFIAVPHNGSGWANLLELARFLFRGNKLVTQMQKDGSSLRRLDYSFSHLVQKHDIQCLSFFETQEIRIPRFHYLPKWMFSKGIKIVSAGSAAGRYPQDDPVPLDGDHFSVCKINPSNRDNPTNLLYKKTISCIRQILNHWDIPPHVDPDTSPEISTSQALLCAQLAALLRAQEDIERKQKKLHGHAEQEVTAEIARLKLEMKQLDC